MSRSCSSPWIHGNAEVSRIDGYLVEGGSGPQVFVVGLSETARDAVLAGLRWTR